MADGINVQPLVDYLINLPARRLTVTFEDLEQILGHELPQEAHAYRDWWSNDYRQAQSQAWLTADWRVESAYVRTHVVTFARQQRSDTLRERSE